MEEISKTLSGVCFGFVLFWLLLVFKQAESFPTLGLWVNTSSNPCKERKLWDLKGSHAEIK